MLSAWGLSCASSSIGITLLLSYLILSYLIISYLMYSIVLQYIRHYTAVHRLKIFSFYMSCRALYPLFFCTVLSHILHRKITLCYGVIRHDMSCHLICIILCHTMSCHLICIILCHTISCHLICIILCHTISCHVMSCYATPCHIMSCHVTPCHIISCHVMLCHTMSCHVMSHPSMRIQAGLDNKNHCTLSSLSELSFPYPTLPYPKPQTPSACFPLHSLSLSVQCAAMLVGCIAPDVKEAFEIAPILFVPQVLFAGKQ